MRFLRESLQIERWHRRSKHMAELGESSSSMTSNENLSLSLEKTCCIIRDIGRYLADEKHYMQEHIGEVFQLQPSDSFVEMINNMYWKFKIKRKKDKDNFLRQFYGINWKRDQLEKIFPYV